MAVHSLKTISRPDSYKPQCLTDM